MTKGRRIAVRLATAAGLSATLLAFPLLALGCSFNPARLFARNACDLLNCDVLFFVDDMFPLSAAPIGGGSAAPTGAAEVEEEEGGHAH